jgi:imidazolonepropionase-like amidohydrolase
MNAFVLAVIVLQNATVWTPDGPIEDASIVIQDDRIIAVGKNVREPSGAVRIDLDGAQVTPGLIEPASRLGVLELPTGVPTGIEGTLGREAPPIRAALRVADTFNPRALAVGVARQQGITSSVVVPSGGVISGQSAWVELTEQRAIRNAEAALHITVRGTGDDPGSRSRAFLTLRSAFEDARLFRAPGNRGAYIQRRLRELGPSALDLVALERAIEGGFRVVVEVDRAADIETVLQIVRDQKLDAVLLGAREGWIVADAIAAAGVPVILDPDANLPDDLDTLASRKDNAARLIAKGVKVAFTAGEPVTRAGRLRIVAGGAVGPGVSRAAALAAITRVPAEIFGMSQEGQIRRGYRANLVVWNGDPLEPLSWPTRMFIGGREVELRSHQDRLLERYRILPAAPAPEPAPDSAAP